MTDTGVAPTSSRIESLDFVRGVALFGILLMNIVGMGLGPAYDNPTVAGGAEGINLWTWFVMNVGFEGTQRALFSMLFGSVQFRRAPLAPASGPLSQLDRVDRPREPGLEQRLPGVVCGLCCPPRQLQAVRTDAECTKGCG